MPTNWKHRRVLVTSGTGFVGSFLVEKLLDLGATVRVPIRSENYRALSARRSEIEWMEGDLRNPEFCVQLLTGIDDLFHLASHRRNSAYHQKRCSDVAAENVRMTLALVEALKEATPEHITLFSSGNVPPVIDVLALAESETCDGYVLGKAICESLWLAAARQRSIPLLTVRPVGVYGPRDTFSPEGNIIPALMVEARDAKEELVVWGDGSQERAFLYVTDLVDALLTLRENDVTGVQYITSSIILTMRELAEAVRDLVRPSLPIRFDPGNLVTPRTIPILPLHSLLQKKRWTPFDEGLRRTYEDWTAPPA